MSQTNIYFVLIKDGLSSTRGPVSTIGIKRGKFPVQEMIRKDWASYNPMREPHGMNLSSWSVSTSSVEAEISNWKMTMTRDEYEGYYLIYRYSDSRDKWELEGSKHPRSLTDFRKVLYLEDTNLNSMVSLRGEYIFVSTIDIEKMTAGDADTFRSVLAKKRAWAGEEKSIISKTLPTLNVLLSFQKGKNIFYTGISEEDLYSDPAQKQKLIDTIIPRSTEIKRTDTAGVLVDLRGEYFFIPASKIKVASKTAFTTSEKMYGGYSTHFNPSRLAETYLAEANKKPSAKPKERDVPKYVLEKAEYFEKEKGYPTDYAFAMAWSIWCKYKDPTSKHCKKDRNQYLRRTKKANSRVYLAYVTYAGLHQRRGFNRPVFSIQVYYFNDMGEFERLVFGRVGRGMDFIFSATRLVDSFIAENIGTGLELVSHLKPQFYYYDPAHKEGFTNPRYLREVTRAEIQRLK